MTADQACRRIESSLERQTRFRVSATGSDLAEITPASILFNPTSPRAINNGNERWKHTHTPERRRKSARVIARLIYAKSRDVRQYQFSAAVQRFSPHVRARARARRPPPSLSSVSLPRIYGRAINTARRGKRGYRGGGEGRAGGGIQWPSEVFARDFRYATRIEALAKSGHSPRELETAVERQRPRNRSTKVDVSQPSTSSIALTRCDSRSEAACINAFLEIPRVPTGNVSRCREGRKTSLLARLRLVCACARKGAVTKCTGCHNLA